jgi:pimeloyl-ACP methyl ester carboxylesterase
MLADTSKPTTSPPEPQKILEECYVELGELEQWVTIRGDDDRNPLLLVLHGGPGMPYSILTPWLQILEARFTVVQWDRRGSGRTFRRHTSNCGILSFEQLVHDAIDLRGWLELRIPGRKVVLVSSSAGTLVALPLVHQRPDLFDGWVACDFNAGILSEEHAMPATLEWADTRGSRSDQRFLDSLPSHIRERTYEQNERLVRLRDSAAGPLGVSHVFIPAIKRLLLWRPLDAIAMFRGMGFSSKALFPEMRDFDARGTTKVEVPLFVLQGELDPFTPVSAARAWYGMVEAPSKEFEVIPGGGHAAAFAQPDALFELLVNRVMPIIERSSQWGALDSQPGMGGRSEAGNES